MKPQEQKDRYVVLRAEGKSYAAITKELNISKSSCSKWENTLVDAIAEKKAENLNQLYNSYYMTKEARIKKLGDTLQGINDALDGVDLTAVAPEKLLNDKLKYTEALKGKYVGTDRAYKLPQDSDSLQAKDLLTALADLLKRVQAGEVTEQQANRESTLLVNLLKAFDDVGLQTKIDALEAIIGGWA